MFDELEQKALSTIHANIIQTESGDLLAAGGNQFRTFWTRDFCFSVPGLLAYGFESLVEGQLKSLFSFKNSQNLLPRGLDQIPPQFRVVWNTFFRGRRVPFSSKDKKIEPEYYGEHGTPAFDSNLLFIQSVCLLAKFQKRALIISNQQIQELLNFYQQYFKDSCLHQPKFSDWQDSARREGEIFHTQLLYHDVLEILSEFDGFEFVHNNLKKSRTALFQWPRSEEGLFFETKLKNQFSLDSHCRLLSSSKLLNAAERKELYSVLKNSKLWLKGLVPGQPVFPDYLADQISWTCQSVGLRHYHDQFYWGWLIAEAAKLTYAFGDNLEGDRILATLHGADNNKYISEVYEIKNAYLLPVKRFFYQSENPFTWSAAKCLEALAEKASRSKIK